MRFARPLVRATLVRRYKRFLADVRLEDGTELTAHVATPGAMLGLSAPGRAVWLSRSDAPTRKLPWSLDAVEDAAGAMVGVNTAWPNRLVAEALAHGAILELDAYDRVQPEAKLGAESRIDFRLDAAGRPPVWLEAKGATLSRTPGLAEWPDCVSARASRHLRTLAAAADRGAGAAVIFVALRGDCDRFAVAGDLDPAFAAALNDGFRRGVKVLCYACRVNADGVAWGRSLPCTGLVAE